MMMMSLIFFVIHFDILHFTGGPIQVLTPKYQCTYFVVGVTSFGKGCGIGFGVYSRVSQFLDWIEGEVWQTGYD